MDVTLPPDLERYAAEAVAAGRFRTVTEVVTAGVKLLQSADTELAAFAQSLEDARTEAERDGWIDLEDALTEADAIIRAKASRVA